MERIESARDGAAETVLKNPNAGAIDAAINSYPYFARLRVADAQALVEGLRAPAAPPTVISRIEVDPEKMAEAEATGATRVSRSAVAMEAHTDSTFLPRPHEILAMDFVRPSEIGGETIIVPVDDIIAGLDDATRAALETTPFPFNEERKPILEADGYGYRIRFNWLQIEKSAGEAGITEAQARPIERLRATIAAATDQIRFRAGAGEVVLVNNRRALHSRTAFPPDCGRLMIRYRCNSDRVR